MTSRFLPYLWAVAAVSIAVVLRLLMTPALGPGYPFITLFPAVFLAAFLGGFWPGVLATAVSVFFAIYIFKEPRFTFSLTRSADQVGVAFYLVSGFATAWLGELRLRSDRRQTDFSRLIRIETERAEDQAVRAEEEAARAEEEAARAEEERLRAEEEAARAEQEARRAEAESERVERILSSITDAFMVLDREWTITYVNDRAAELAGRKPADFIGRNHWEAFPEAVGGPFEAAFREAMRTGHVVRVEARYQPVSKWLHATIYPSAGGITVVSQDVTERIEAQKAAARLAAIVKSSQDAIVGKDLDGTITSWNDSAERIFGYTAAEMVGDSIYKLIPPNLHASEREILTRVSRGEPVQFSEAERIRKDGEHIFVALTVSPIRDASGQVVGASSIKRDITGMKIIQQELAEESVRRRELAQALDAAQVMIRDLDGRITYWSSGAAKLYGWSMEEAIGSVSHELLHTQFPAALPELEHELLANGKWEGELIQIAKDGRRLNLASQWILQRRDGNRPVSVIEVNSDMTAQRQIEERIRRTERLEVVGQLAGGVAHEANNQMTVVLGSAEFVLRRSDLPDTVRKDVEHIRAAAERTAGITAQLLAFSRRQVVRPQVLILDEAVQQLEDVLRRTLGERIVLMLQLRGGGAKVRVDPGQLTQVLLNLTLNARDAMPGGGQMTIETTVTNVTEETGRPPSGDEVIAGSYVVLSVTDTGHGMSSDTLRHIFEPFYTTKPVGQGTGLGLATVYGIVKQTGGHVWAQSEPGAGAVFHVYLPVDEAPVAHAAAPRPSPYPSRGESILLVEDEPGVRYTTSRALQEHGYVVREAASGVDALELLERDGGPLDLLIVDVVMPGLSGPELAREIGRRNGQVAVLYISGYTDDEIVRRGLLDSGAPLLQKPFSPDAIVERVGDLLKPRSREAP